MAAERLAAPHAELPEMEMRRWWIPGFRETLNDFRALGASCFHVPIAWFAEVFDVAIAARHAFVCWVGYRDGSRWRPQPR